MLIFRNLACLVYAQTPSLTHVLPGWMICSQISAAIRSRIPFPDYYLEKAQENLKATLGELGCQAVATKPPCQTRFMGTDRIADRHRFEYTHTHTLL